MTITIPSKSLYTLKEGMTGTPAWVVQRACNEQGISTGEDAVFGPATTRSAILLQERLGLSLTDGIVGPQTQLALAKRICAEYRKKHGLPDKLLDSDIGWESGGLLCAVNWGTPGGVDCGIVQRRIYTVSYQDQVAIKRAFDPEYQVNLLAASLRELHDIFLSRGGTGGSSELAWRLAVLNHNYPYAADQISRKGVKGLSSYWFNPQDWVVDAGVRFPDGQPVHTPLEWCMRYSLGSKSHNEPGQGVKLVVDWTS